MGKLEKRTVTGIHLQLVERKMEKGGQPNIKIPKEDYLPLQFIFTPKTSNQFSRYLVLTHLPNLSLYSRKRQQITLDLNRYFLVAALVAVLS